MVRFRLKNNCTISSKKQKILFAYKSYYTTNHYKLDFYSSQGIENM